MITIAELRARNGKISQSKLAKDLGVSLTTVASWEKDQLSINSKNLVKLAEYFNVSADSLLGISLK